MWLMTTQQPEPYTGPMIGRPAATPPAEVSYPEPAAFLTTPAPVAAPPVDSTPIVPAPVSQPLGRADLSFGDHKGSSRQPVIIDLVGVKYAVIPPKMRTAVRMFADLQKAAEGADENPEVAFAQYDEWIAKLFRDRAPEVIARMEDDDDELDLVHINQLTQALMARAAGADPTSSPSA